MACPFEVNGIEVKGSNCHRDNLYLVYMVIQ